MTAAILHIHPRIGPGGGPHGYLANLRQALAEARDGSSIDVSTIAEALGSPQAPAPAPSWLARALHGIPGVRRINHALRGEFGIRFERAVADWTGPYEALTSTQAERLLARELTVVHDTFLAARLLRLAPGASRARLALMTHAPGFYAHQLAGDLLPDEPEALWHDEACVARLRAREVETMRAVKAVVWPSPGAAEGYGDWGARGAAKPPFVATGVQRPQLGASAAALRQRWGVEAGQKLALFMGRPHPQKGFDVFVDWADAEKARAEWVFVQAGGAPRHTRRDLAAVRQVGYESDNGAAYSAADLVVFPNREAYLDIGLLECLSLGAPVAVTAVGGHADLLRESPDLLAIPPGPDAWRQVRSEAVALEPERRERLKAFWATRHSPAAFAAGHRAAAASLLS